jgi:alpha-L-rhamnosidase
MNQWIYSGFSAAKTDNRTEGTSFIWYPDGLEYYETPRNAFCMFRRSFDSPTEIQGALLRIFADTYYVLWINGQYICRGPCRADPRYAYFDEVELKHSLLPGGNNVIAVLAVFHGYGTGRSVSRFPLLLANLEITSTTQEKSLLIKTDNSWRTQIAREFNLDAPRMNGCQGIIEVFDARNAENGWISTSFDDSHWKSAKVRPLRQFNHPFWNLKPRPIPMLLEESIQASPSVKGTTVSERKQPIEKLFLQLMEEQQEEIKESPCQLDTDGSLTIPPCKEGAASIRTFDFGRVEVGYAQLDVTGPSGTVIDVAYAELLIGGRVPAHQVSNRPFARFTLDGTRRRFEIAFAWRSMRYLRLTVRNTTGAVTIHSVGLRTRRYPLERLGSFETSDSLLSSIWEISARTLEICAQDAFVDSPGREQQQWMGDGRWQAVFNYHLSGDPRLHRKLLEQIGQGQDCHGLTKSRYPDGHENFQPIPSFTLAWVSSFRDYHLYQGDLTLAKQWWPNLQLAMRWFDTHLDENSLLTGVPHWCFMDWSLPQAFPWAQGSPVTDICLNLQYVEALGSMTALAAALGEVGSFFSERHNQVREAVRKHGWNDQMGSYSSALALKDSRRPPFVSEVANALALLHLHGADDNDPRVPRIIDRVFRTPPEGIEVRRASPYFMHVVLRSLAIHGNTDLALKIIRERYGALLAAGGTSLWEMWEVGRPHTTGINLDSTSASHAWGAAPLAFFHEFILGLRILEPGWKKVRLSPQLGDLPYAEGIVPTPLGPLRIAHSKSNDGKIESRLEIPPGCKAVTPQGEIGAGLHRLVFNRG